MANVPPNDNCPFCNAGKDALTLVSSWEKTAVACTECGAQGPMRDDSTSARLAWQQRHPPIIELGENQFAVVYGFEKFLLTYEQMIAWRELDERQLLNRVGEKRRLLQEWQLLPPTKLVDDQRPLV